MSDELLRIFKDGLFETKKSPDRDWGKIAERAGGELYEEVSAMFPYPEVALCGLVRCLAEVVMCQTDKSKRQRLIDRLRDVLKEQVVLMEKMEDEDKDAGYGDYEEDEPEEEGDDEEEGPDKPKPEEEEVDDEAEVDFKKNQPDPPGPEPEEGDEEEADSDKSPFGRPKPTSESGWKPIRRGPRKME